MDHPGGYHHLSASASIRKVTKTRLCCVVPRWACCASLLEVLNLNLIRKTPTGRSGSVCSGDKLTNANVVDDAIDYANASALGYQDEGGYTVDTIRAVLARRPDPSGRFDACMKAVSLLPHRRSLCAARTSASPNTPGESH